MTKDNGSGCKWPVTGAAAGNLLVLLLAATAGHCWGCCCDAGVAGAAGGSGRDWGLF